MISFLNNDRNYQFPKYWPFRDSPCIVPNNQLRGCVEITRARHRGLRVIIYGDSSQFLPIPSSTGSNHITQYTWRWEHIPDSCWKHQKLRYKDGKRRRDGMEVTRQHGYAQLYWRRTNSLYESQWTSAVDIATRHVNKQITAAWGASVGSHNLSCTRRLHTAARLGPGSSEELLCFLGPVPTGSIYMACPSESGTYTFMQRFI